MNIERINELISKLTANCKIIQDYERKALNSNKYLSEAGISFIKTQLRFFKGHQESYKTELRELLK